MLGGFREHHTEFRSGFQGHHTRPRSVCDSLNAEVNTGGQSKLVGLLGWHYSPLFSVWGS